MKGQTIFAGIQWTQLDSNRALARIDRPKPALAPSRHANRMAAIEDEKFSEGRVTRRRFRVNPHGDET